MVDEFSAREGGDKRVGGEVARDTLAHEHPEHPTPYKPANCPDCGSDSEPVAAAMERLDGIGRVGFHRSDLRVAPEDANLTEILETAARFGYEREDIRWSPLRIVFSHPDAPVDTDAREDERVTADGGLEPSGVTYKLSDSDLDTKTLTPEFISEFAAMNGPTFRLESATFRVMTDGEMDGIPVPDIPEFPDADVSEDEPEPMTDGGMDEPLDTSVVPEREMERFRERREMFTCPDCGQVADVRLTVRMDHTVTTLWKRWAAVHTEDTEDGETHVYIHVDGEKIERGSELRELVAKHTEDTEPDPFQNPEGEDGPAGYEKVQTDPREPGDPMTDGGVDMAGPDGLGQKFTVLKDGEEQNGCFVLKPESDPAAREALSAYADATENSRLETDLNEWLDALDHTPDPGTKWKQSAVQCVQKWGRQDPDALALAMGEELGEFAGDILAAYTRGDTGRRAERGRDLLRRLESLGKDITAYLESVSEDDDGDPIPPEDRPDYLSGPSPAHSIFHRRARNELDDMMAIGHQLQWALDREDPDKWRADSGGEGE